MAELAGDESHQRFWACIEVTVAGIEVSIVSLNPFLNHKQISPVWALIVQSKKFLLIVDLIHFSPCVLLPGRRFHGRLQNTGERKLVHGWFRVRSISQEKRLGNRQIFFLSVRIEAYFIHQHFDHVRLRQGNMVLVSEALPVPGKGQYAHIGAREKNGFLFEICSQRFQQHDQIVAARIDLKDLFTLPGSAAEILRIFG